ncbi:FAS1-like dehydratase domain-containing protein [Chitinasiproducens palmae]|uniref:3-methylfumaryl-CoA hydratase n=1 Tax=Chitinasiproducens palmae TaxID=1770053 RepID=A0A1H2PLQ2_9BURK|nr:MaoC family dehydratase N-terminal domain-containing protein [Chitinasiproducens palmae]SDV47394.1 3-methylfumaryl-CoA hydratase [Chitinasiproducens palmae]
MNAVPARLDDWLGREETAGEVISAFSLRALAATLDSGDADVPTSVPPLWHWMFFQPTAPQASLGEDGHPQRGGFLPPVALPRRMWAGGRLTFHAPLPAGTDATRHSTIAAVDSKTGRTGQLVFVTVQHRIETGGVLCVEEEQDIVYRDAPRSDAPAAPAARAPDGERWSRTVHPDPTLLFRYSALTFNGHRIHYDHPYVTAVEGYPDLVVHGPLIATLLVDLVRRTLPAAVVRTFSFRAQRPVFANRPLTLCGLPSDDGLSVELWAKDHEGYLAMRAVATLA